MNEVDRAKIAVSESRNISLSGAMRVVDSALLCAEELGCRVSVVVLDAGGNVSASVRMDGTAPTVTTVAGNKANTALTLRTSTDVFLERVQGNAALVGSLGAQPGIALMAGGVPLVHGDQVIGAIGVSGSLEGKDPVIARAGAAALDS